MGTDTGRLVGHYKHLEGKTGNANLDEPSKKLERSDYKELFATYQQSITTDMSDSDLTRYEDAAKATSRHLDMILDTFDPDRPSYERYVERFTNTFGADE